MQFANAGTFRTFDYLHWRQLDFYETQLSYLENQLHRLDVAEDKTMRGSQKSKFPFNKEKFADCCLKEPPSVSGFVHIPEAPEGDDGVLQDEFVALRERLYAHIECVSKKYRATHSLANKICSMILTLHKLGELVDWLQKASTFPRVPEEAHSQLFTAARELHGLEGEALQHLTAIDEMAYVNLHSFDSRIQRIWLSTAPWIKVSVFMSVRDQCTLIDFPTSCGSIILSIEAIQIAIHPRRIGEHPSELFPLHEPTDSERLIPPLLRQLENSEMPLYKTASAR